MMKQLISTIWHQIVFEFNLFLWLQQELNMSQDIENKIEEKAQENEILPSETKEYTEEFDDEIEEKENVDAPSETKEYTEEDLVDMKDIENENEEKAQETNDVVSETKEYTEVDLADMKEKFMMFDDDGGGGLTSNELEKCKS